MGERLLRSLQTLQMNPLKPLRSAQACQWDPRDTAAHIAAPGQPDAGCIEKGVEQRDHEVGVFIYGP